MSISRNSTTIAWSAICNHCGAVIAQAPTQDECIRAAEAAGAVWFGASTFCNGGHRHDYLANPKNADSLSGIPGRNPYKGKIL